MIHGGRPLYGKVEISGAKNAAVADYPAALLVDGCAASIIFPRSAMLRPYFGNILQELGAEVRTVNRTTVEVDCSHSKQASFL